MAATQFVADPKAICTRLLDRSITLLHMKEHMLDVVWTNQYSLQQLRACCDRMAKALPGIHLYEREFQKELIENPSFADYYAKLLRELPDGMRQELEPPDLPAGNRNSPSMSTYRYTQSHDRRDWLMLRLSRLLQECRANEFDITAFATAELIETMDQGWLSDDCMLRYLLNFAPLHLNDKEQGQASLGLSNCVNVPLFLDENQRAFLRERCVGTRVLFSTVDFEEVRKLFESAPGLLEISRYLEEKQIDDDLLLDQYRQFATNPAEYLRLFAAIFDRMEVYSAELFLRYWEKSGFPLNELQTMEKRITQSPDMNLDAVFATYPGYVNLLYGKRFKVIDLNNVRGYQEDILLYSIVKNKKRFIRMVDEHADAFLALPRTSLLFEESLYTSHLNLNELGEQELKRFAEMKAEDLPVELIPDGRKCTIPEIYALYGAPSIYLRLYFLLCSEKQDYRLRVIKQLIKRDVLPHTMADNELSALAAHLDQKPLHDWMQSDFAHIDGLLPSDAALLLSHLQQLYHLLPSLKARTDVALALRHVDIADQFTAIDELKQNIISIDHEWHDLSEKMQLSQQFHTQYQKGIFSFLCRNGAQVANVYRTCLDEAQEDAFLRVVKAELMGKLRELKYYEGDLQKELSFPLNERVKSIWQESSTLANKGLVAREYDDFFSTMYLGTQPQRTCLSHLDGQYRSCLLAGFDSNKKVLYAKQGNRVIGRAYLRLTKGRLTQSKKTARPDNGFTFVDLENVDMSRPANMQNNEYLTLFLERPYVSGVDPETELQIKSLFIDLATRKAEAMGIIIVLSWNYHGVHVEGFTRTQFDIYISKTKAGSQYLDSLDGHAEVSSEGSYKSNSFLIRDPFNNLTFDTEKR